MVGRPAYVAAMQRAYEGEDSRFRVVTLAEFGPTIATVLVDDRGGMAFDVFRFEDGVIVQSWEYLPPRYHDGYVHPHDDDPVVG